MPEQAVLWHDSISDAIGAAVAACGGAKRVSGLLWPAMKPEAAYTRLKHALNDERAEKLSPDELMLISKVARDVGDYSIGAFYAREIGCEFKPLTPAESKKRAKKARVSALLAELARLADDE